MFGSRGGGLGLGKRAGPGAGGAWGLSLMEMLKQCKIYERCTNQEYKQRKEVGLGGRARPSLILQKQEGVGLARLAPS
jgi:hypothetical protein